MTLKCILLESFNKTPYNSDGALINCLRRARIESRFQVATHCGILIDPRLTSPSSSSRLAGLLGCLLKPGQFYLRIQKSLREEFNQLIKSCATRTDPAAETKSIRLLAFACTMANKAGRCSVVMVFARHLDNFILT